MRIRQRLRVTSTRAPSGGLDVLIQYQPSRTRVGLRAKLTLIEPVEAQLVSGVRQERGDRYGAYAAKMPDETISGPSIETSLKHLQPDPHGVFAGLFYVVGLEGSAVSTARVRTEIWTDVGPTRLASREVPVRAISW